MGSTTEAENAMNRPGWQVSPAFFSSLSARLADPYAHDDTGDARRHFRWNFKMTRALGAERATAFANGHEVSGDDRPAEHEMDLHNNAVGRAMARDPRFSDLSSEEVAKIALRNGCLQTRPK